MTRSDVLIKNFSFLTIGIFSFVSGKIQYTRKHVQVHKYHGLYFRSGAQNCLVFGVSCGGPLGYSHPDPIGFCFQGEGLKAE